MIPPPRGAAHVRGPAVRTRPLLPALLLFLLAACGRERAIEITSGPLLSHVGATEATVVWTTDARADGAVHCFTTEDGPTARDDARVTVHRLRVAGLHPGTTYNYRVRSGGARSGLFRFTTAPAQPVKFTVAVYGRSAGAPQQHARIADAILAHDPALVVHTGGYADADDETSWHAEFLAPARPLYTSRAFVPAAGPGEKGSTRFDHTFPTPTGARWHSVRRFHVELFCLDLGQSVAPASPQHDWLRSAIRRSTARWKIAVCDLPLLSGDPGQRRPGLRHSLFPVFYRTGVDLVLTGGRVYERTDPLGTGKAPEANALVCVSTLAAGPLGRVRAMPWTAHSAPTHGYLLIQADADELAVTARAVDGRELDSTVLRKTQKGRQVERAHSAEAVEAFLAFSPPYGFGVGTLGPEPTRRTFAATVTNPYPTPIDGELRWRTDAAEGWTMHPATVPIHVPPRAARRFTFAATIDAAHPRPAPLFAFAAGERELAARQSPFEVMLDRGEARPAEPRPKPRTGATSGRKDEPSEP